MKFKESETIELKEIVTKEIKKEIVAFANSYGGKLYIGVKDDGTVIGLKNFDETSLQIINIIRDSIKPDLSMFVRYNALEIEGKEILEIEIQSGNNKPYYLSDKGPRPEGVYVRQGNSCAQASSNIIRQMIKATDNDTFENFESLNQELTFESLQNEFQIRGIPLENTQMRTLKLIDNKGYFSNIALLLSDQCNQSIKAAVFQGTDKLIFKDRQEFQGSLLDQLNQSYDYIDFRNQTRATFNKLLRLDRRDYPEVAIREALLNLLIHRDYSIKAPSLISIFDDRIEFVSIGGLLQGISLNDLKNGISVCRNIFLASIFYRLKLIEAYGTGIEKIMDAYEGFSKKPVIESTENTFKITIPNINYAEVKEHNTQSTHDIDNKEEFIKEYLKNHKMISRSEVIKELQISAPSASRLLQKMLEEKLIEKNGNGRSTKYCLKKD